jgi:putative membrane protein
MSAALLTAFMTAACGGSQDTARDETTPGAQTGASATAGMNDNDRREFVQKAAIGNMAEVQLGKLALQKAQSAEVKKFAQMMVDEHTKALSELRQAAGDVDVPEQVDETHRDLHDRLSRLQGREFDREYMNAMVEAHEETEDLLDDRADDVNRSGQTGMATPGAEGTRPSGAATGTTAGERTATGTLERQDQELNQWAARTLPAVRTHLERAKQIQERVDDNRR